MLGLAIAWFLFVPIADWLAHHDVGSATGSLHETAVDNARGRLLTLAAGLFAAGALVYTALNFRLSREGQVTDRYTKAIEQLGSDKLDMRIGGFYALERIAHDSARDQGTVMDVLAAFVREHSREPWPVPKPGSAPAPAPKQAMRPDVRVALAVTVKLGHAKELYIDLSGADLTGVSYYVRWRLTRANLTGADFTNAHLTFAPLTGATLTGARTRRRP